MTGGPNHPDRHPDDAELIRRVAGGDADAFAALYSRHRDWALALAWRFTKHHADALDVTQETFAYLWKRIPTLRLESRLTTFLYPAVRSRSLDAIKRRQRHRTGDALPEPPAPGPAAPLGDLRMVLEALGDDHREVVLMRFVHDMTVPEIAAALSIPLGTAKTRLHHALARLRADPRVRAYFDQKNPDSD